jgi:hypothetical protein
VSKERLNLLLRPPHGSRPAGLALDASLVGFGGYHLSDPVWVGLGAIAQVRVAAWCDAGDASRRHCSEGRETEVSRQGGALRVYGWPTLGVSVSESIELSLSARVPLSPLRDFDFAAQLAVVWRP